MLNFSFIHASDLHLDVGPKSLPEDHSIDSKILCAQILSFQRLIDESINKKVHLVLFAGDIFDSPRATLPLIDVFKTGLEHLASQGIYTLVICGNHDESLLNDPNLLNIKDSFEPFIRIVPSKVIRSIRIGIDHSILEVIGLGFGIPEPTKALEEYLLQSKDLQPKVGMRIVVYHGNAVTKPSDGSLIGDPNDTTSDGFSREPSNPYGDISVSNMIRLPVDYWALGHVHNFVKLNSDPHVVYSGTTQGRSIKPSECGPKGSVLVSVKDSKVVELDLLQTSTFEYRSMECELSHSGSRNDLAHALRAWFKTATADVLGTLTQGIANTGMEVLAIIRINVSISRLEGAESIHNNYFSELHDILVEDAKKERFYLLKTLWNVKQGVSKDLLSQIFTTASTICSEELLPQDSIYSWPHGDTLSAPKAKIKNINLDLDAKEVLESVENELSKLLLR